MASERSRLCPASGATSVTGQGKEADGEGTPLSVKGSFLKFRWRVLVSFLVLWIAYVFINAAYSVVGPFFPLEAKKKGSNSLYTGIIIGCAPFFVFIFSPIFGYYLPVVGLRFSILSGLFLVGGSYLLMGFTYKLPTGWVFIVMCILLKLTEGVGSALFLTGGLAIAPQYYPKSVGTVTGLLEAASGLGFCIGPSIGGALYAAGGFGVPFWVIGGICLFLILPLFLIINTSGWVFLLLFFSSLFCEIETHSTMNFAGMLELSSKFIILLLMMTCLLSWTAFGFIYPIFQPFLFNQFGLSEEIIGLVFLSGALVYMLASLFLGKLSDIVGPRSLIITGFAVDTVVYFLIGPAHFISTPKLWLTVSAYSFYGIGASCANVPIFADMLKNAKRVCPSRDDSAVTGVVSGIITSMMSLGQAVGPIAGGALNHVMDFQSSTVIIGEVLIAQCILLLGVTFIDRCHLQRYHRYKIRSSTLPAREHVTIL